MPTNPSTGFWGSPASGPDLLHEIGQIYAAVDEKNPEHLMMESVARLLPCFAAVLNAIHLRPNQINSWSSLQSGALKGPPHPAITHHLHEHPALDRLIADPAHTAVRLDDCADPRSLDANPFVAGYYRPHGLHEQIVFSVGSAPVFEEGTVWVVGVNRLENRPFTDAEVELCNVLQPHLARAIKRLENHRTREAALVAREGAANAAHCGLAAIQPDGSIADASFTARRLLDSWYGPSATSTHLPVAFTRRLAAARAQVRPHVLASEDLTWMEHRLDDGASLTVHWRWRNVGNGLAGLWLRESVPADAGKISRALGLTQRQATVAQWITEGKTNPEIGLLLGISSRTVDKHVEGILERLNVESRNGVAHAVRSLST